MAAVVVMKGGWLQPCSGDSNGAVHDAGYGGQQIGNSDGSAETNILGIAARPRFVVGGGKICKIVNNNR